MRRRLAGIGAVVTLLVAACGGGGANERTILVDFSHDEFASFALFNFPREVKVHAGTELVFRQTWTGEPHTVTGGSAVDELFRKHGPWFDFFDSFDDLLSSGTKLPDPESPGDATVGDFASAVEGAEDREAAETLTTAWNALRTAGADLPALDPSDDAPFEEIVDAVDEGSSTLWESLPWALDEYPEDGWNVTQNAGRACYLTDGLPPEDVAEPCPAGATEQPEFDGTYDYYTSGIIPFEGPQGNTYRVQLADDLGPGTYSFYCAVHGFGQRTEVEVVAGDEAVPSPAEVAAAARAEIDETFGETSSFYEKAVADVAIEIDGERVEGPFAGLSNPAADHVTINEFVPKRLEAKAGEPITWKMMGADHSISFDVPEYFPIVEFLDDGTVRLNPKLNPAAGGAPEPPEQEGEGVAKIDGGTYDGEGFWSSGLIGAHPYLEYTLRISKPGTYKYACLLHPPMVGTVVVS